MESGPSSIPLAPTPMTQTLTNTEYPTVPSAGKVLSLSWPMTTKAIFLHGTVVIDGWLISSLGEA